MPTSTPNYDLALYNSTTDQSQTFDSFRAALAGDSLSSNMSKIDSALFLNAQGISLKPDGNFYITAGEASPNTYTALGITGLTSYYTGLGICVTFDAANTSTCTLEINDLGAKNLKKISEGSEAVLSANDILINKPYYFVYNGYSFVLVTNTITRYIMIRLLDSTTDCYTGTSFGGDFECPVAGTITAVGAYVDTAGTTGSMTIDVNKNGTTIMSTNKITIETGEKSSRTATTQPGITTSTVAIGDLLTFDIDAIQTTPAKGLTIRIEVRE